MDFGLHTGEFDGTDEKVAPMKEETVEAFGNLAYDFVWQTMTEQSLSDKAANWLKEVWDYSNVGRDEGTVRYLMDAIAKTEFDKPYQCSVGEQVVYMYDFILGKNKVPLALHILEDEPSFKRNDLVELDLGGSEDKLYVLLAFCEGKDQSKAKVLVQVGEEHVDQVREYFTKAGDNVLADGTLLGDPFPTPSIVPSGDYGKEGGRFGCTRTSSHSQLCKAPAHSYVTPRGVAVGRGERLHSGIDLYASLGTNLHTILGGNVVGIDEIDDSGTGKTMVL